MKLRMGEEVLQGHYHYFKQHNEFREKRLPVVASEAKSAVAFVEARHARL